MTPLKRLLFGGFFVVLCYRPDWRINVKLFIQIAQQRHGADWRWRPRPHHLLCQRDETQSQGVQREGDGKVRIAPSPPRAALPGQTRINSVLLSLNHVIRHRFTVYHTIELRSMTFTLGKTRINSVLLSLNHVIRHKPLHNIPLMRGFLQLFVILQRQIEKGS